MVDAFVLDPFSKALNTCFEIGLQAFHGVLVIGTRHWLPLTMGATWVTTYCLVKTMSTWIDTCAMVVPWWSWLRCCSSYISCMLRITRVGCIVVELVAVISVIHVWLLFLPVVEEHEVEQAVETGF